MATLFDVLVLAVLIIIAAELFAIFRGLAKLSRNLPARMESKEGQTINVNLGQLPVASVPVEAPIAEKAEAKAEEEAKHDVLPAIAAEPEPEVASPPPPPLPPPPRSAPGLRATTSGLTALKCPKCQAENSSYRAECFNCGEKLK